MTPTIPPERLAIFDTVRLEKGSHSPDGHYCSMELVAYLAGEPWSDKPACACPVIAAFVRHWQDDMNDADRQVLKPYLLRLVGTKSTPVIEQKRGWMLNDWTVRTYTPAWLELAELREQADALRILPEIRSPNTLMAAQLPLRTAREKASAAQAAARAAAGAAAGAAARAAAWAAVRAAAGDAAGAAVRAAAWAAARDAAWDAAGDAARAAAWAAVRDAAGDAARAAAWAAVRAAAGDAAGAAAWEKLKPTTVALRASALDLLDRLIACGDMT